MMAAVRYCNVCTYDFHVHARLANESLKYKRVLKPQLTYLVN